MNAEIEQGHLRACLPHPANISYATGRTLTLDPATETFQNDAEANTLLTKKYRNIGSRMWCRERSEAGKKQFSYDLINLARFIQGLPAFFLQLTF